MDNIWQAVVPKIAFEHQHMMHRILSLTALHLVYLYPLEKHAYIRKAAYHHNRALTGLREAINSIGPSNGDALFASAISSFVYAVLSFGKLYNVDGDASNAVRTSRVLGAEWIPLVRGIEAVLRPLYAQISIGPLSELLSLGSWYELDLNAHSSVEDDRIVCLGELWRGKEDAETYEETLQLLRRANFWMRRVQDPQNDVDGPFYRDWAAPFVWLFLTPERYFELQRQRQPFALIIFAYYGVLLQQLNKYWWAEGCAMSIVSVVEECLGPYWDSWMEWPKQIVGL